MIPTGPEEAGLGSESDRQAILVAVAGLAPNAFGETALGPLEVAS
jgi:hypothetical protein